MPTPPQLTVEDIVSDVLFCLLAVLIVFGNSLVIGAFKVNRRLRTTTNLLLMSLAVADMLIGSISMPLWVYISITSTFKGHIYIFYQIFDVICGVSSILNLTAISLERCYALIAPIKHRNIRKSTSLFSTFVLFLLHNKTTRSCFSNSSGLDEQTPVIMKQTLFYGVRFKTCNKVLQTPP